MDQGFGAEVASSPAAVGRKRKPKLATRDDLPTYWRDDQGRLATLVSTLNGKATFYLIRRGGCQDGRTVVVSTFEMYRTWHPDLGQPIPSNAMPSICTRAHP